MDEGEQKDRSKQNGDVTYVRRHTHDHRLGCWPTCPAWPAIRVETRVVRRSLALDADEMPCRNCHVGEPHACPLLREETVVTYG